MGLRGEGGGKEGGGGREICIAKQEEKDRVYGDVARTDGEVECYCTKSLVKSYKNIFSASTLRRGKHYVNGEIISN